jgi:hypothetical protein
MRARSSSPPATTLFSQPDAALDPRRYIRQRALFLERLAVSMATGYRLQAAGKIGPKPTRCGGVKYFLPEVLAWLQHRRPDGQLHDAKTWPPVWQALQKAGGR